MLIPLETLIAKYKVNFNGVLHVGAHVGEEAPAYARAGAGPVTWIEANPELIPRLSDVVAQYGHRVVQALVSDVAGVEREFIVTNNGQSSSMLELARHKQVSPEVHEVGRQKHTTTTIDDLDQKEHLLPFNFINLDIQGAELLALQGARGALRFVDYIYAEINIWEIYAGCARVWELDEFLAPAFVRVETAMAGNVGWGDGFWIRRPA